MGFGRKHMPGRVQYWTSETRRRAEHANSSEASNHNLQDAGSDLKRKLFEILTARTATVLTIVVTTLTLVFLLNPRLKPPEPPDKLGASIVKVGIRKNVTMDQYPLLAYSQGARFYGRPRSKGLAGIMIYVKLEVQGLTRQVYAVDADLYDAVSSAAYTYEGSPQTGVMSSASFVAAPTDSMLAATCWVSQPPKAGKYFIRVRLYRQRVTGQKVDPGVLVDFADSPAFRI
jgi:hypothetical protein